MFSLNRVQIIGYQTQPVSIRQTPGGTSVTDLNLVVPYNFRSASGEQLTGKGFHTVTLWGPMADVAAQYVRPGAQIFISGRLQTDSWEDAESKEKRSKTKIVGMDMILLDPKSGQSPAPEGAGNLLSLVNRADVIGNVTKDPELRTTTSGQQVLTIGVATNEKWKDRASGEMKERAEFHNIVLWGDLAQSVSSHVKKGQRVFVSGRVQTRSWETQAGAKRTTTEIIADTLTLLGVENSAAKESIDMSGAPRSAKKTKTEGSAPSEEEMAAVAAVPEVNYTSEIKAEDLPF
jgi:single-strand DNA-binding protein